MAAVPITFYLLTKDYPEQVGLKSREADAGTGRRSGSLPHYLAALKHGGFMTACVSVSFHHAVRWGLLSFLPAFFMEVAGWKIKGAGFVASALPLGMGFGALAGGYISDKVFKAKRANTIFISMIFCAACAVLIPRITVGRAALRQADQAITSAHAQTAEHNLDRANDADTRAAAKARTVVSESRRPIAAIMLLISGFMLYTSIGPYFSLCPDLLGVNNTGTGYGIMNAFAYGGAAAGTFTISNLVERFGYNAMFLFLGGCALTAAMLIKLVREKDTA
jgi:sugar phosphate permease